MIRLFIIVLIVLLSCMAHAVNDVRKDREDPTKPERWVASETRSDVALPTLSSVLIGSDRKLAVIDGRTMSEGEQRGNLKLWKVESDRVVVSLSGGGRLTLRLDRTGMNKEVR